MDDKVIQPLTKTKIKRAVSGNVKDIAPNKLYHSLIVKSSEMPASF